MKKTALALLLALLMAAALLTSGALASDDETGPVAKVGNEVFYSFDDALKALKESKTEYWLDLLRDVTVDDAQYVIDSIVQIDGHGHKLTLNAPEDEDACIFTISEWYFLEIRNTELYINGNGEGTVFKIDGEEYNNTAVYFYISDAYITGFENAFDFVEAEDYKDIVVDASLLNITDISGSVSNGGNWNIWGNMNISNCTGSGFTADFLGLYRDSSMTVSGIVTGGLNVAEYSSLTVSGCGSKLPIASAEAPDGVSYKYPVEIRAGGNVTIGYDAKLVLEGNNINSVYLVSGSSWYAAAHSCAAAKGVSDGEQPGGAITREQLVTMLYRLAGEPETTGELTAPDAASVSSWAKAAMIWAMENGLIEGDETGAVNPGATATRAQAAALLARYLTA